MGVTAPACPAISVVMPAYNAQATIAQAIRSVLGQTMGICELIVVDDASTDKTAEVVAAFAAEHPRVKVVANKENSGVARSRNRGVEAAYGDLVAFLDSDDVWRTDKLEKQFRLLRDNPGCSLCFTGSAFMGEDGSVYSFTLEVPQRLTYQDLLRQNLISCSSVLAKREALLRYPMAEDRMVHEDYATWLAILKDEPYAVGIDEPLITYRVRKHSKSSNKIRAAAMQWRTYGLTGVGTLAAIRYFMSYAQRNLSKYMRLRKASPERSR